MATKSKNLRRNLIWTQRTQKIIQLRHGIRGLMGKIFAQGHGNIWNL